MRTTITIDEVMALNPCYTRERIEVLTNGKTEMPVLEICDLDVPVKDVLWVLSRLRILSDNMLHSLACDFAEHVLQNEVIQGRNPDPRSWNAIKVKRKWIKEEVTNEELQIARTAAYAAAYAAAAYAAYAAAYAAYAADAADAAAYAAAADAEKQWRLSRVKEVIKENLNV